MFIHQHLLETCIWPTKEGLKTSSKTDKSMTPIKVEEVSIKKHKPLPNAACPGGLNIDLRNRWLIWATWLASSAFPKWIVGLLLRPHLFNYTLDFLKDKKPIFLFVMLILGEARECNIVVMSTYSGEWLTLDKISSPAFPSQANKPWKQFLLL